MKHVGQLLNVLIKQHRFKKKDFAEKVGVTPEYLSRVLSKPNYGMPCDTLERMCEVLGEDPSQFFDYRPTAVGHTVSIEDLHATAMVGSASVSAYGVHSGSAVTDREKMLEEMLRDRERVIASKEQLLNEKERLIRVLLDQQRPVRNRRSEDNPDAEITALLEDE